MKLRLALITLCLTCTAFSLSGRAAFVFQNAHRHASLKAVPCPGKLGNNKTRCATASADASATRKKLTAWKGWKQTDPWKGDSASFTSNGLDSYIVTVMPNIGTGKGSLLIFSEF